MSGENTRATGLMILAEPRATERELFRIVDVWNNIPEKIAGSAGHFTR